MAKTALNSDVKLKSLQKQFENDSEKLGMLNDYLFVTQYRAYLDQLKMMDDLKAEVEQEGIMVMVPVGKDAVKKVVNPAVSEYNRMAGLANKTAAAILTMLTKQKEIVAADEDDEEL